MSPPYRLKGLRVTEFPNTLSLIGLKEEVGISTSIAGDSQALLLPKLALEKITQPFTDLVCTSVKWASAISCLLFRLWECNRHGRT